MRPWRRKRERGSHFFTSLIKTPCESIEATTAQVEAEIVKLGGRAICAAIPRTGTITANGVETVTTLLDSIVYVPAYSEVEATLKMQTMAEELGGQVLAHAVPVLMEEMAASTLWEQTLPSPHPTPVPAEPNLTL